MAFIGLKHIVAAKVKTETEGQAIVYDPGIVVGPAMTANRTINRTDNPLYAEDTLDESDNGVTGGTLEIGVSDLIDNSRAYMLGDEAEEVGQGDAAHTEYHVTDASAPYVGVGYYRVRQRKGTISYEAYWYHKAQFGDTTENATTKGQQVEWQTPTITGRLFGVHIDATLKTRFYKYARFDDEAAAAAWLDNLAGITP